MDVLSSSPFVLVLDELQSSGEFVLFQLLKSAVASSRGIVLVSISNSIDRYKACMKKLGVNLQTSLDSSQLTFIDLNLNLPSSNPPSAALDLKASFKSIYEATTSMDRPLLIVDDLSTLFSLSIGGSHGLKLNDWHSFTHLLSCLPTGANPARLILMAHSDILEDQPWLMQLEHRATHTARVSSLGFKLADVDGKVVIHQRSAAGVAALAGSKDEPPMPQGGMSHDLPLEASRTLWFKSSETTLGGVKWITNLNQTF